MKDNTITSSELIEALKSGKSKVFKQVAFSDTPGNSIVYAAPKTPGLNTEKFVRAFYGEKTKNKSFSLNDFGIKFSFRTYLYLTSILRKVQASKDST